jgi:hypothetical protein
MRRTLLALTVVAGAVGGMTLAQHDGHDKGGVKTLSQKDITEKLDGKQAKATTVEVTWAGRGQRAAPPPRPGVRLRPGGRVRVGHRRQTRPEAEGRGYVLRADGCLHRVSKNPSDKNKTRVIAVVLHPHDAKDIVIPDEEGVTRASRAGSGRCP